MVARNAQDFLFQRIRELIPDQESLVDVVAEILHISNDSAYRRIRGETAIVLDETAALCSHFNLSLDQMLNSKVNSALFQIIRVNNKENTFERFLKGILNEMKQIHSCQQIKFIYLTKDLPMFLLFGFRPLFAFRYFFWMKSILQHPDHLQRSFTVDVLDPSIQSLGEEILSLYNQIPSIEIWNTECVNSILLQMDYYRDAGFFNSKTDLKLVYEAIEAAVLHMRDQAEVGGKFMPSEAAIHKKQNFEFFYNRVILGDNTILAITESMKITYLNYNVLNYMKTMDEDFCDHVHIELSNLIKRSTMISTVSEKQRNMFFNILLARIEDKKKHYN